MQNARTISAVFALLTAFGCSAPVSSDEAEQLAAKSDIGEANEALVVGSCNVNVEPLRSIEIVHPNIVDDARASNAGDGAWSFRRMMENMAPSAGAADTNAFVRSIFEPWLTDQFVNGEVLDARPAILPIVLNQFAIPGTSPRQFDLAQAPLRLIAIANRLDLRSATQAGEARLVYGVTTTDGSGMQTFLQFTVILEFALPLKAPLDTAAKWAAKWHELDALDPQTQAAAFSSKLQEITDAFTARGAFIGRPNGSAINQIRTNELALATVPWQLRELNMTPAGLMAPSPTKESPNKSLLNNSQALRDFINQNPSLSSTTDTSFLSLKMPTTFEGLLFAGGKANQLTDVRIDPDRWQLSATVTQTTSVAVDNFGILTCNGCHTENKASGDFNFYQVSPIASTMNRAGTANDGTGRLSGFLLFGDPTKGARRPADLTRRATDMGTLLCAPSQVDLMVSQVSWSPTNPAPGQAVTFSATITNQGTATKAAGTINGVAFRVDGTTKAWSDTSTVALAPGQSITLTANNGPSGTGTWPAASGAHTIEAWVDDVNRIAEGNENNNKLSAPLSVGVDLTVSNISWSPTFPVAGQPVTFSAVIKNVGSVATQAGIQHGVRFEVDGQLVNWSDTSTASLAPGATRLLTANSGVNGLPSWTAVSGKTTIAAWVDDVNRLPDVDRSNNKLQTRLPNF